MKKHLSTILLVFVLFLGVTILLYPTVSDYWNSFHQSRAIARYIEQIENINPVDYEREWARARKYNEELTQKPNRFMLSEEEYEEYESMLNPTGSGIMGYIEIPKINCSLPIYHGTDEAVLQIAVGHIEGTSLPTGDIGTHTVLSGHRGLPSAKLFTDLDQMEESDLFVIPTASTPTGCWCADTALRTWRWSASSRSWRTRRRSSRCWSRRCWRRRCSWCCWCG